MPKKRYFKFDTTVMSKLNYDFQLCSSESNDTPIDDEDIKLEMVKNAKFSGFSF